MSAGGNCWELHPPFVLYRIRKRGITAAACRGPGRMRVLPPKSSKCRARNFTRASRVRQGAASATTLLPVSAKAPLSALTGGAENGHCRSVSRSGRSNTGRMPAQARAVRPSSPHRSGNEGRTLRRKLANVYFTEIRRGCAFGCFGITISRTPLRPDALTFSASAVSGRMKRRWNCPTGRSIRCC
jgi:hypothetical protein